MYFIYRYGVYIQEDGIIGTHNTIDEDNIKKAYSLDYTDFTKGLFTSHRLVQG
jgi:hypothetical protein